MFRARQRRNRQCVKPQFSISRNQREPVGGYFIVRRMGCKDIETLFCHDIAQANMTGVLYCNFVC